MSGAQLALASAGTGKTHHLCTSLADALADGVPPESVLAVTFTNRAAAELLSRGRERLLSLDRVAEAEALALARIGTVHAVFGALVREAALENGRSPEARVLDEGMARRIFREAAAGAIGAHAPALGALAAGFGDEEGTWRDHLAKAVACARENGLDAAALRASGDRSRDTLLALLPAATDGAALEAALARAVDAALAADDGSDATRATAAATERLLRAQRRLRAGRLDWPDWAGLASLSPGTRSKARIQPVSDIAGRVLEHPVLHQELRAFVDGFFAAAAAALDEARDHRRRLGLLDFTDQLAEALALLRQPGAAARLGQETGLLLVDEFQDTSPIQLALFATLLGHVRRALFVGDPKQAIYGFGGAAPELVAAVRATLPAGATLDTNRRSRPALIRFANALFTPVFAAQGMDAAQVATLPHRAEDPRLPPPLHLWRLPSDRALPTASLAAQVHAVLHGATPWMVAQRGQEDVVRPARGGDIALLCRKNGTVEKVAAALCDAGLKVAVARNGLLRRVECALPVAGLRVLADARDGIARAEVAHILEGEAARPDWLAGVLAGRAAALDGHPALVALDAARPALAALAPAEALDLAIAVLDVPGLLPRWGDAASRHAQLDALRALAQSFEEECRAARRPATPGGLADWLLALDDGGEQAPSPDPDAVPVLTVHKAKGLEWPVVVLVDEAWEREARLFGEAVAMPRDGAFDPAEPLAGRWLRFWPWPFGASGGAMLRAAGAASAIGQAAQRACDEEAARLAYVAVTRARDALVLAPWCTKDGFRQGWLGWLPGGALALPRHGATLRAGAESFEAVALDLPAMPAPTPAAAPGPCAILPAGPSPDFPPRRLAPSAASGGLAPAFRVVTLGPPLPVGRLDAATVVPLGEALHGILAADRPAEPRDRRLARAARLLAAWDVALVLPPEAALEAADRLWRHLEAEFPGAALRREWPVTVMQDGRVLSGRTDLMVEAAAGLALYDHKSDRSDFAGSVARHAPQLAAYAAALAMATGRPVVRKALHLPLAGVVLVLGE